MIQRQKRLLLHLRGRKKKNGNLSSIELKLVSHLFMSVQILPVYFLITGNEGKFSSKQQAVAKMLRHFDEKRAFLAANRC